MTTIITRVIPATNYKPARIVADAGLKRRIVVSYDHGNTNPHKAAAIALCQKFNWEGSLVEGGMERGAAFVFVDADATFQIPSAQREGGR